VAWDSLRPNFFLLLSPGLLEDRDATYLTSFFLPAERQKALPTLLRAFPSVSIIAVDGLIAQLQQIVARVSIAVEVVLFLVLGAGALVLLASIQSTMDERLREYGLLRALGGSRQRLQGALVVEFATLGTFAGLLAALGAELMIWAMETQLFGLPAQSHGILWLLGPVLGVALVLTLGLLATRKVVSVPPLTVLREHGA
jgi:putative ABC transport system permease protein